MTQNTTQTTTTQQNTNKQIVKNLELTGWTDVTKTATGDNIVKVWTRGADKIIVTRQGEDLHIQKNTGKEDALNPDARKITSSESKASEYIIHMAAGTLNEFIFGELDG